MKLYKAVILAGNDGSCCTAGCTAGHNASWHRSINPTSVPVILVEVGTTHLTLLGHYIIMPS